jgi:hypothetical protein
MLSLVLNHATRNRGKNLRRIKKGCDPYGLLHPLAKVRQKFLASGTQQINVLPSLTATMQ